jgi:sec-independent protein translocase protein TatA
MGGWDAPWHWVIIAVLVIALFGYKKLPDASRSLGRSLRIFKTEIKGMSEDDKKRAEAREVATPPAVEAAAPPVVPPAATPPAAPAHPVEATSRPAEQYPPARHADATPNASRPAE